MTLQVRQVDLEAERQVRQTLSHPWQFPVLSICEPSEHPQVAAAELYSAVLEQEVHPLAVGFTQVRQEEWQTWQTPKTDITVLLLQRQAPFTRLALARQLRQPEGVPLLVRQVKQV